MVIAPPPVKRGSCEGIPRRASFIRVLRDLRTPAGDATVLALLAAGVPG